MNLMDAIYHRRAIRDYSDAPVDQELIRFVIAAAIEAPNAMNRQPWSFVVVTSRAVLDHCAERAKAHMLSMLSANPHLAGYREHLATPSFNIFYNAPALVVVCATAGDTQAAEDCALAAQNLMLAAHGHGLGTCCIGFARPWFDTSAGKAALGIPAAHVPVIPIIIGWPKEAVSGHPRRPPDIHWLSS